MARQARSTEDKVRKKADGKLHHGVDGARDTPEMLANSDDRPVCLLILGMHRSGTSALARTLSLLGAALPRRLMGAGEGNVVGHWEPERLVHYHDQFLAECGTSWHDWRPLDLTRLPVANRLSMQADMLRLVKEDYFGQKLVVLKDPRICRFPTLFLDVLQQAGYRTLPILSLRNPVEITESLVTREIYWPSEKGRIDAAMLWLSHMLEAEAATRDMPRAIISYERLFDHWQELAPRLEAQGGFRFPIAAEDAAEEIDGFLDPTMRHHAVDASSVRLDPVLRGWTAEVYDILRRQETGRALASDLPRLDAIRHEFLGLLPILETISAERNAARKQSQDSQDALAAAEQTLHQQEARLTQIEAEQADRQHRLQLAQTEADHLRRASAEKDIRISALDAEQARFAGLIEALRDEQRQAQDRLAQNAVELDEQRAQAARIAAALEAERSEIQALLDDIETERGAADHEIDQLGAARDLLRANTRALVDMLNQARDKERALHQTYRGSTSWRAMAPLRWFSSRLRGLAPEAPAVPGPLRPEDWLDKPDAALAPGQGRSNAPSPGGKAGKIVFFTICSRNFMAFARTLHQSLLRFYPGIHFHVALCDDRADSPPFVAAQEKFDFIYLDELGIPDWREMSQRYNVTEFNTAIKPFVFQHLFQSTNADHVVYFDPDIYVVDHLTEIEAAFGAGADVILTPHMLEPNERAEMNERRLLQYGIYNLGFLGVSRTPKALEIMAWWARRLEHECIIKRDEGLFVDQKWADHFPAFFDSPAILHHPGYNLAYWNLSNRKVTWRGQGWWANDKPLRFVHFSGNDLDNPKLLSRHSGEHRADTIGELKALLDEYRDAVFANGHHDFRRIPYAFSWNGASGVNEHTPRPDGGSEPEQALAPTTPARSGTTQVEMLRTAIDIAGGPGKLIGKAARAISRGDVGVIRERIALVRDRAQGRAAAQNRLAPQKRADASDVLSWRKRILVIEWTTPRPDADSGSRTVFYTAEILTLLGYDVTFLPIDLKHAGRYTEALERIGITCIDASTSPTARGFFQSRGGEFDFVMLNRVSVVGPHMADIRRYCSKARLVFNTVDLHYLRELRDAELNGQSTEAALRLKSEELDIVRSSDATIVLSSAEHDILQAEVPEARVEVLPLVFNEIDPNPPGHAERADILFIGSFPHKPNVDAILYFADEIFPALRARLPGIRLHVVGSEPTPQVLALATRPGIVVHGFVADLTPLFRSVIATIAPLRFGAGIKGKVATSLAYGVPCVCTPVAAEGMNLGEGQTVLVAETVTDWCDAIGRLCEDPACWESLSAAAQEFAVSEFSVAANALRLARLMASVDPDPSDLVMLPFTSKSEFDKFWARQGDKLNDQRAVETALVPQREEVITSTACCAVCGQARDFTTPHRQSGAAGGGLPDMPTWSAGLVCSSCGLAMRHRLALHIFLARCAPAPKASLRLVGAPVALHDWLAKRFSGLQDGGPNDASSQSDKAGLDAILCLDELQAGTEATGLLERAFRDLRPGGTVLLVPPIPAALSETAPRPSAPQDAPQWGLLSAARAAGFATAEVIEIWSQDFAYLGGSGVAILARKA